MLYNFYYKLRPIGLSLLFITLFIYFCYHTIIGERGVIALFKLDNQVSKSNLELDYLRAERLYLEHRVNLVKSESLDLDLIDEQARRLLGYAASDETIYFLK